MTLGKRKGRFLAPGAEPPVKVRSATSRLAATSAPLQARLDVASARRFAENACRRIGSPRPTTPGQLCRGRCVPAPALLRRSSRPRRQPPPWGRRPRSASPSSTPPSNSAVRPGSVLQPSPRLRRIVEPVPAIPAVALRRDRLPGFDQRPVQGMGWTWDLSQRSLVARERLNRGRNLARTAGGDGTPRATEDGHPMPTRPTRSGRRWSPVRHGSRIPNRSRGSRTLRAGEELVRARMA